MLGLWQGRPTFDQPAAEAQQGDRTVNFGGNDKKKSSSSKPSAAVALGPYPDDNAKRMPVANSPSTLHAARKKRREIMSRGGRESTRLAGGSGVSSFINQFLGGT
jgi:hypothetical protein